MARVLLVAAALLLSMPPAHALKISRKGPASAGIAATLKRAMRAARTEDDLRLVVRTRRTRRRIRVVVRVSGRLTLRIRTSMSRHRRARRRATRRLARRVVVRLRAKQRAAAKRMEPVVVTQTVASLHSPATTLPQPTVRPAPDVSRPTVRHVMPPPPRLPVVEINLGIGYGARRFAFDDGRLSIQHATGGYPELVTSLAVFPLRAVDRSAVNGLGLRLTYARALGLTTTIAGMDGTEQTYDTDASRGWAGLVFALPHFGRHWPRLELRAGFALQSFMLEANELAPPHLEVYVGWGAAIVQPIAPWLKLRLGGEYRAIVSAIAPLDSYRIGFRSVEAGLVRVGVEGILVAGLGYRVAFDYEPLSGSVPAKEGDSTLRASGHRLGVSFGLGYGF